MTASGVSLSTTATVLIFTGGVPLVLLIGYGLWCDPVKPWIEERMWRRDQRRLQHMRVRAACMEVRAMEEHFAMPCAPDPQRLA